MLGGIRRRIVRRRTVPVEDAANRVSAYVYGNIVIIATLATLTKDDAISGHGLLLVLGIAVSTFFVHAFADAIGHRIRSEHPLTMRAAVRELRDSVPVLSSAIVPALLLLLAFAAHVPPVYAQIIGGAYLVIRLAVIGVLVARYRGKPSSPRVILAGIGLALVGAIVTAVKIVLGH